MENDRIKEIKPNNKLDEENLYSFFRALDIKPEVTIKKTIHDLISMSGDEFKMWCQEMKFNKNDDFRLTIYVNYEGRCVRAGKKYRTAESAKVIIIF